MEITCKVCGGSLSPHIKNIFDDRYGYPELFDIARCSNCHSFITLPPMAMDKIEALYTNYYPRKNISSGAVKERSERWKKDSGFKGWLTGEHRVHRTLPQAPHTGIKVLDIGCGDGSSLLELQSLGYESYGIETDNNLEKVKKDLNLNIFIGTVENAPFPAHSFDIIIANQVIEHVVDLKGFVMGIDTFLAPGGTVVVSTPNAGSIFRKIYGRKWIHWHIPYHQQVLSKKALELLFTNARYTVNKTITVSPSSWTVHEINRARISPVLGSKNPFWIDGKPVSGNLVGKVFRRAIFIGMSAVGKVADIFIQGNCLILYAKK